ncbi:endonuclease III [uncultured Desulfobacter sp.]|uniref:endonuclease III domain-containing protein n=1 Tax=uncultured Desulfobacter sp. TaxID=240139 RepID=UPI002AAC1C67|nr:endonuclease III [uncultured Desulfobacter sp.]
MAIDIAFFLETLRQEVETYQVPVVDLIAVQSRSAFKVLVATILSARTKDEVTALAAQRLLERAPDTESLRRLSVTQIQDLIFPVGFYKSKAQYLSKLPEALDAFGGKVPDEIDALVTLPGVGRKTANLVRAVAFDKDAICVDTHVHRIMNIWGYVKTKTPLDTEKALRKKLPKKFWKEVNRILVAFGQGTCRPVGPHCYRCILEQQCPQKGVTPAKQPKDLKKSPGRV